MRVGHHLVICMVVIAKLQFLFLGTKRAHLWAAGHFQMYLMERQDRFSVKQSEAIMLSRVQVQCQHWSERFSSWTQWRNLSTTLEHSAWSTLWGSGTDVSNTLSMTCGGWITFPQNCAQNTCSKPALSVSCGNHLRCRVLLRFWQSKMAVQGVIEPPISTVPFETILRQMEKHPECKKSWHSTQQHYTPSPNGLGRSSGICMLKENDAATLIPYFNVC